MQINSKNNLLDIIELIGNRIKKLDESDQTFAYRLEYLQDELKPIAEYLDCNDKQALLFSVVFYINISDGSGSMTDIGGFLKCSLFELLRLESEIQDLVKKKYLIKTGFDSRRRKHGGYVVPDELIDLITKNQKAEPISQDIGVFEVGDLINKQLNAFRNEELTIDQVLDEVKFFQQQFPNLGISKLLNQHPYTNNELIILIYIFTETCLGEECIDLQWGLNRYVIKIQDRVLIRKNFLNRTHKLISTGVLEFQDGNFRSERFIRFTNKSSEIVFGEEANLFDKKDFNTGACILTEHTNITEKELYYSEKDITELNTILEILEPEKYKALVSRLEENKLASGVAIIFHGHPGTGKTESVYQFAKKCKRNILMVDISQIRDKYVGESEKQLKEVFNVYRKALKFFDEAPILLFNESDALISKRMNVSHSVDQMNNSMQNILLQEMENFKGILIATTNLINNLDNAFERRFLFKVKFSKPDLSASSKIWKSKISSITDEESTLLAEEFDFSGGQIDNICKKILMSNLLNNKISRIDDIRNYCNSELFIKRKKKSGIGFRQN